VQFKITLSIIGPYIVSGAAPEKHKVFMGISITKVWVNLEKTLGVPFLVELRI